MSICRAPHLYSRIFHGLRSEGITRLLFDPLDRVRSFGPISEDLNVCARVSNDVHAPNPRIYGSPPPSPRCEDVLRQALRGSQINLPGQLEEYRKGALPFLPKRCESPHECGTSHGH